MENNTSNHSSIFIYPFKNPVCMRCDYKPWDVIRAVYAFIIAYLFMPTGGIFLAGAALTATGYTLKGSLLALTGGDLESASPVPEYGLSALEIGLSFLLLGLLSIGVVTFLWLSGLENGTLVTDDPPRRFGPTRPFIKRALFALGHYVGIPLLGLFMVYMSISQTMIGLKLLGQFFAGNYLLVPQDPAPEYPASLTPLPQEYGVAVGVALGLFLVCVLASRFVISRLNPTKHRVLPYRPGKHSQEVILDELASYSVNHPGESYSAHEVDETNEVPDFG